MLYILYFQIEYDAVKAMADGGNDVGGGEARKFNY